MKPVLIELTEKNDKESTDRGPYLLIGDRRQTIDRIVEQGILELYDEPLQDHEGDEFTLADSGLTLEVTRSDLVDIERVDDLKAEHYTVYVNENVTEDACQVSYSYHPK